MDFSDFKKLSRLLGRARGGPQVAQRPPPAQEDAGRPHDNDDNDNHDKKLGAPVSLQLLASVSSTLEPTKPGAPWIVLERGCCCFCSVQETKPGAEGGAGVVVQPLFSVAWCPVGCS